MSTTRDDGRTNGPARRVGIALALLAAALLIGHGGWIHGKGWLGQQLMARAWGEARAEGRTPDAPWPGARTRPVARLSVPELKIDRLVLEGADLPNLAWGPGMTLGSQGHRVIAGHRDTHFRFLGELAPGDHVQLESGEGEVLEWKVIRRSIVDSRTTAIDLEAPGPMLTLLTCYPLDGRDPGTPFRLVLAAEPLNAGTMSVGTMNGGTGAEAAPPLREALTWAP